MFSDKVFKEKREYKDSKKRRLHPLAAKKSESIKDEESENKKKKHPDD